MVGSTSEVLEPGQNIDDLSNVDVKDDPLFMLNTNANTDMIKKEIKIEIPNEENQFFEPNTDTQTLAINNIKLEVEEQYENESNALERFIIVEDAVEEVTTTTTYDEHILELCQEEDNMDIEQYEDIGYESLSSPEYDYRAQYTPHIFTNLHS